MSEQERILQMLADGLINVQEATNLLNAIKPQAVQARGISKALRVSFLVDGEERGSFNIPMSLTKYIQNLIPHASRLQLEGYGFDISNIFLNINSAMSEGSSHTFKDSQGRELVVNIEVIE
jgi:hypothetical protein